MTDQIAAFANARLHSLVINHHHHHIYFRLPERPQKPIELAIIKQQKENCKNEKKYKKINKNDFQNIKEYAARPKLTITAT